MGLNCSKNTVNEPTEPAPNNSIIDLSRTEQIIRGFGGVNMPGS